MPEFDQSLYWKLVPYFRVPMERVHVILVVSGPSPNLHNFCGGRDNFLAGPQTENIVPYRSRMEVSYYCGPVARGHLKNGGVLPL